MGDIRQFQSNASGDRATPQASFVEDRSYLSGVASADLLRDAGSKFNEGMTAIQREKERVEQSEMAADMAITQARLTIMERELALTTNAGDYEAARERFLTDEVEGSLSAIGERLETSAGRDAFARMSAQMRAQFMIQTAAEGAEKKGEAQINNLETVSTARSNSTRLNPTMFEANNQAITDYVAGLDGLNENQRTDLLREKLKQNAVARIEGIMEYSPDAARRMLEEGLHDDLLDSNDVDTLLGKADQQQRFIDAERGRQLELQAAEASNSFINGMIQDDGSIRVTPDQFRALETNEFLNTPEGRALKAATFNMLNTQLKHQEAGTTGGYNQQMFSDYIQRALLPRGHPDRLDRTEVLLSVGNGLDTTRANYLEGILQNEGTPEGRIESTRRNTVLSTGKAFFGGDLLTGLFPSPEAATQYADFENWALQEMQRRLDAGESIESITAGDGPVLSQMPNFKLSAAERRAAGQRQRERERGNIVITPPPNQGTVDQGTIDDMNRVLGR